MDGPLRTILGRAQKEKRIAGEKASIPLETSEVILNRICENMDGTGHSAEASHGNEESIIWHWGRGYSLLQSGRESG